MVDERDVKVSITVVNNAAQGAQAAAQAVQQVGKSAQQTTKDTENLKKASGDLNSTFSSLTSTLMTGLAAAGLGMGLSSLIAAAGESEKVVAQLGAVLKSTGGQAGVTSEQAIQLSKSLEQTTTFGDEAVLSAENLLLTFTNIGKNVFPQATQTVLDMSVALGEDTRSAAIQLGKALQDPIDGITALKRVGVNFTDQQKEMITKLVESGKGMEAQKMILDELTKEFGGSAQAAAKTYSGQLDQMKERFNDLQEELGMKVLPYVIEFMKFIEDHQESLVALLEVIGSITVAMTALKVITTVTAFMQGLNVAIIGTTASTVALNAELLIVLGTLIQVTRAIQAYNGLMKDLDTQIQAEGAAQDGVNKLMKQGEELKKSDNKLLQEKGQLILQQAAAMNSGNQKELQHLHDLIVAKTADIQKDKDATTELNKMNAELDKANAPKNNFSVPSTGVNSLKDAVTKLGTSYKDLQQKGSDALAQLADDQADALKKVRDDIKKTQQSIEDLTSSYNQTKTDDTKSVAEDIVASENKIADIKKQLSEATTDTERQNLQQQLDAEQKNYDSSLAFRQAHLAEIQAAESRAKETDLQRAIDDYNAKRQLADKEYQEKLLKLQNELADEKQQELSVLALYAEREQMIKDMMDQATKDYQVTMDKHKQITLATVNAEIDAFSKLSSYISTVKSGSSSQLSNVGIQLQGTRAAGGPVSGGGAYLVGETGPEIFVPSSNGAIVSNKNISSAPVLNIVINYPQIRSDNDINVLSDAIFKKLSRQSELYRIGALT